MPSIREACDKQIKDALKEGAELLAAMAEAMNALADYNREYGDKDNPYAPPQEPTQQWEDKVKDAVSQLEAAEGEMDRVYREIANELGGNCSAANAYAEYQQQLNGLYSQLAGQEAECRADPTSPGCLDAEETRDAIEDLHDSWDESASDDDWDACWDRLEDEASLELAADYAAADQALSAARGLYQEALNGREDHEMQYAAWWNTQHAIDEAGRELGEFLNALDALAQCASQHAWSDAPPPGGDGGGEDDEDEDEEGDGEGGDEGGDEEDEEGEEDEEEGEGEE